MKKLVIHLDQFAHMLEQDLQLCLKPYPRGVYRAGREAPIITFPTSEEDPVTAWSLSWVGRRMVRRPVLSLEDVRGEIVDKNGSTIIPANITANRERFLSLTPTVPVYGRCILFASVCGFLSEISEFDAGSVEDYLTKAYSEYITRGYMEYVDFFDVVKDRDSELLNQIREFTGTSTWTLFEPKRKSGELSIEDLGDYRIFEWEQRHGAGEIQTNDSALYRLIKRGC